MWQDPIVAETRILRDEYSREFDYDLDAIFNDLMAKQATHPERMVSLAPRRPVVSGMTSKRARRKGPSSDKKASSQDGATAK